VTKEQIDRINALARKQKAEGLSEEETSEQLALRREYLRQVRESMRQQLDSIYIEDEDGQYEKLQKKE